MQAAVPMLYNDLSQSLTWQPPPLQIAALLNMFMSESKKIIILTGIEIVLIVIMNYPHNVVEVQVVRKEDKMRIIILLPGLMIGIKRKIQQGSSNQRGESRQSSQ
eukprot:5776356-Ditylum_brightwellii.AAC.1